MILLENLAMPASISQMRSGLIGSQNGILIAVGHLDTDSQYLRFLSMIECDEVV